MTGRPPRSPHQRRSLCPGADRLSRGRAGSRSVSDAASGTSEIAQNITGVAEAAHLTSQGVAETQQATTEMARMSTQLSALITNFRLPIVTEEIPAHLFVDLDIALSDVQDREPSVLLPISTYAPARPQVRTPNAS